MNPMLLFAALLSAPLSGPKASTQDADVKAIKAAHSKLLAAINDKNASAIKSLFTKGFTQTAYGMNFNRDKAVAQMTQGSASTRVDWTISGIKVQRDKAAYTSNFKYETSVPENAGKPGSKVNSSKVSGSGVQRVRLVKEGGKWLYSHLEVLPTSSVPR